MSELPPLISDLALILVSAGIVTLIFKKLNQPLVLGYIVAGFLVGPHMALAPSVVDRADIQTWADIGVMFLLFSLGLDFSFKKILKMGAAPFIAAFTIIFFMMSLGVMVGRAFGWSRMDCIFLGGMLAMSSTTIIYKAFNDMGLRKQQFAGLVMSVLILEDILAIVLMVMLSAMAHGSADSGQMIGSLLRIVFFLVLWFVVGLFVIPIFLRHSKKLMNEETLLIVALGLCCFMAVVSTSVGFSSAFGAFVMGSILAETVEAEKIEKLVEPVKNLFGAIFFVSVGMLVDVDVLVAYAMPIIVLVITIIVGQAIFGTLAYMLSGQPLKNAMRCGFSMSQIGEFSFIIASLGLSMGVIGKFLYPVVVAVSVITTFFTPYMIRLASPAYGGIERILPKAWLDWVNSITTSSPFRSSAGGLWKKFLHSMIVSIVVYSILSMAVIFLMFTFFLPFIRRVMGPDLHWWANGICGVLTVAMISPFLRSMAMKKVHGDDVHELWKDRRNRAPIVFLSFMRLVLAILFIFYICNYLTRFKNALIVVIAMVVMLVMIFNRTLKRRAIYLESIFQQNLRSKDVQAVAMGKNKPKYAENLLDRNVHISDFDIPENSHWAGKTLSELNLRKRFGVHISSVLRGRMRLNIPNGDTVIFPSDKIEAIGSDEQLTALDAAMKKEVYSDDSDIESKVMHLHQLDISKDSPFIGKTLKETGIRDKYDCMVVGLEEGKENLTMVNPLRKFQEGDIIWLVGEESSLKELSAL